MPRMARLWRGETTKAAPGTACENQTTSSLTGRRSRQKAKLFEGRTTCQGWQGCGVVKPPKLRQGLHARTKQPAALPVGAADKKRSFLRAERLDKGEDKRLRSAASCAVRAPPSCARWPDRRNWGLAKPLKSRQGRHAQTKSRPIYPISKTNQNRIERCLREY